MSRSQFVRIDSAELDELAKSAGVPLPLEQSGAWDPFDEAVAGRRPWGRFAWILDGDPVAVISLSALEGRGFTYLWAKHGPVWFTAPTPTMERQFREGLAAIVREADRSLAFIRLHAEPADDLVDLLQSVTYDRTVVLDLTPSDEERMNAMKKRGRRDVRKALRDETMVAAEETASASAVFGELYELLVETGARDEFGIAPRQTYELMLSALGPQHGRLFTVRRGGRPLCWGICTVNGAHASYYYAASNEEGRKSGAPDLLVWSMAKFLKESGVQVFDLMGIDSDRAPQLAGVRGFKTKFSEEITEIPGAWDYPLRPLFYRGLVAGLKAKRRLIEKLRSRSR
ncbi:lipid II:glycine glycyltransferase (peptidoglycan interpeptide bridge formation enzyme) [Arcanobacterium wilhelmae]|uniref:Lipid II:glycine glycyltransferase (Peptidoglycan interpeptide bridge formation enzyme) n=1 Tax=Arcanobacterium wilhelmae TaxID=1803177 RepID=A0ABT9N9E4_9ACTO|nr:GNAT family N-acetyltransferase [Arcanobacterium wilhelmae]MDP9800145.1 lipid II:glycine glycyltransferase (peptidoglycan interpeptide bridge formation enzyme) [Arcanobacterium wilhelmae]WFN89585.1 peptidoglycan bridge formation glycyltransferase FemA/FemB family protein [Arcanobacterium wilhelmae]